MTFLKQNGELNLVFWLDESPKQNAMFRESLKRQQYVQKYGSKYKQTQNHSVQRNTQSSTLLFSSL